MHRYKKLASCWVVFGLLFLTSLDVPASTVPASCFGALYDGTHSKDDIDALIGAPWRSGTQTLGPGITLHLPDGYVYLTPQDATALATVLTTLPLRRAGKVTRCGARWLIQVDIAYFAHVDTSELTASIHSDDLLAALEQHRLLSTKSAINFDPSPLEWLERPAFHERTGQLEWAYSSERTGHAERMLFGDDWIVSFSVEANAADMDAAREAVAVVAGQLRVDKDQLDKTRAGDIHVFAEQAILPGGHRLHIPEEGTGATWSTAEIAVVASLGLGLLLAFTLAVSRPGVTGTPTQDKETSLRGLIERYRWKAPLDVSYDDPLTMKKAKVRAPLEFLLPLIPLAEFKRAFMDSEFFVLASRSTGKPECMVQKEGGEKAKFLMGLEPASFVEKSMATPALLLAESMRGVKRDDALPNDRTFIRLFGHELGRHLPPEGQAMHIVLTGSDVMYGGKPISTNEIISLDAAFVSTLLDGQDC